LQSNHYNSLFYLAQLFAMDKIKRWPEAIQLLTGCIALRHDDIYAYLQRAKCHQKLGQRDDAEADYTAAITAAPSEEERVYPYALRRIFYQAVGQPEKARQDHERLVSLYEQAQKAKAKPGLRDNLILNNMAAVLFLADRLEEAIALWRKLLEQERAMLGPDHLDTADTMQFLARTHMEAGEWEKAIELLQETVNKREAQLGPDDPETLEDMTYLARAYRGAGQFQKAIALNKRTLAKLESKLGPDHGATLNNRNDLANAYLHASQLAEAIALHEQTLEKTETKFGPDHQNTLISRFNLADAYRAAGKLDKADPLLQESLERFQRQNGLKWFFPADALASSGLSLPQQQEFVETELIVHQCLRVHEDKRSDRWGRFYAMSLLGSVLLGQQKYTDAEPLLLQGYEGMKQREARMPVYAKRRLMEVVDCIVRVYEATGQAEKARTWREKSPEMKSQK
jgi:tetratricopeptide (TPR) repeat protein